jgi:AcrR family transcriptional regulator
MVEMQRRRLLSATAEIVYEGGAHAVNVAVVCKRAGVSRRTFYEVFEDRERCLLVVFEEAVATVTRAVIDAVKGSEKWCERVRIGLTALLTVLDGDPGVGRLLIVEALAAGDLTLSARRLVLAQAIAVVDDGRSEARRGVEIPPLMAEGIVGAVFSVIHARMLERDTRPLSELTGPLMAMIVQPYLGSGAAKRELERPCSTVVLNGQSSSEPAVSDPFRDLPIRLTYRTARVLSSIAATPGCSSKQIALVAGVTDQGQMSRLLRRLERVELVHNASERSPAKGEAKAWWLTERGEGVLRAVGEN